MGFPVNRVLFHRCNFVPPSLPRSSRLDVDLIERWQVRDNQSAKFIYEDGSWLEPEPSVSEDGW